MFSPVYNELTHWGQVTHLCISKLTIIGSYNGLSPSQRQAIIWTNAGILSIGPLGMDFSEILMEIDTFSFKKMRLKILSAKWRPSCLGLNVLSLQNTPHTTAYILKKTDCFETWIYNTGHSPMLMYDIFIVI